MFFVFQPMREVTCKLHKWFIQSMTIFESPRTCKHIMFNQSDNVKDAQTLRSYALVLEPCPQFKVHL